jgi:hypothetical protein
MLHSIEGHLIVCHLHAEGLTVLDMLHPLLKERDDMLVVDAVIHLFAITAGLDHTHLALTAHMVRNG